MSQICLAGCIQPTNRFDLSCWWIAINLLNLAHKQLAALAAACCQASTQVGGTASVMWQHQLWTQTGLLVQWVGGGVSCGCCWQGSGAPAQNLLAASTAAAATLPEQWKPLPGAPTQNLFPLSPEPSRSYSSAGALKLSCGPWQELLPWRAAMPVVTLPAGSTLWSRTCWLCPQLMLLPACCGRSSRLGPQLSFGTPGELQLQLGSGKTEVFLGPVHKEILL